MQAESAESGDRRTPLMKPLPASRTRVQPGQLVRSCQGRDSGRWYLVVGAGKDGFVHVADGERRRVAKPKRKNPRHLLAYDGIAEQVSSRLAAGRRVTDAQVREALLALVAVFGDLNGEEVDDAGEARCD